MTSPDRVPAVLGPDEIRELLPPRAAVEAIEAALRGGLDPAADPARSVVPAAAGQILLMPSEAGACAGVKIVTVAAGNPARGLPRIQGLYLLLDADTLTPVAVLDGAALTAVRTPAVSVAAVRPFLERGDGPLRVTVFGAGPQARAHVETIAAVAAGRWAGAEVTLLVRRPDAVPELTVAGVRAACRAAGGPGADRAVAAADVIVCATTARTPVFDSTGVRDDAVVVAVGSHEPDAREVDGALAGRAHVVVEDAATALREAGDVVQAVAEGHLDADDLIPMREVVTGARVPGPGRPVLFKSTGMAWQDLTVAAAVHRRRPGPPPSPSADPDSREVSAWWPRRRGTPSRP